MSNKMGSEILKSGTDAQTDRYVIFTSAGIHVDIDRYLRSEKGKAAIGRIDKAGNRLKKEKVAG